MHGSMNIKFKITNILYGAFCNILLKCNVFVGRADEPEMLHCVCNSELVEVLTRFSECPVEGSTFYCIDI
jgi:hypothetical protein